MLTACASQRPAAQSRRRPGTARGPSRGGSARQGSCRRARPRAQFPHNFNLCCPPPTPASPLLPPPPNPPGTVHSALALMLPVTALLMCVAAPAVASPAQAPATAGPARHAAAGFWPRALMAPLLAVVVLAVAPAAAAASAPATAPAVLPGSLFSSDGPTFVLTTNEFTLYLPLVDTKGSSKTGVFIHGSSIFTFLTPRTHVSRHPSPPGRGAARARRRSWPARRPPPRGAARACRSPRPRARPLSECAPPAAFRAPCTPQTGASARLPHHRRAMAQCLPPPRRRRLPPHPAPPPLQTPKMITTKTAWIRKAIRLHRVKLTPAMLVGATAGVAADAPSAKLWSKNATQIWLSMTVKVPAPLPAGRSVDMGCVGACLLTR
jgi:hypothetical protein